ncbi:MAG: hypothetical protein JW866_04865 [Ignavibacteriales bacterium]|nr:hypothetical protein [Ignavibacteriales bacterium]
MKKFIIPIIAILLVNCSGGLKLSDDGTPEKTFVTSFLNLMIEEERDYEQMREFISPSYLIEKNAHDYKVNSYFPVGFSVDSYNEGVIITQIWGEDKSWVHQLTFKVVIENEKYYLYPSSNDGEWIDPWFGINAYIND